MKNKGASLVELMVSCSILVLLIFMLFMIMETGRSVLLTGDTSVELRRGMIDAFTWLENDVQTTRPSLVSVPAGGTSATLTLKVPQDVNGDGTVLDANGNVEWSGNVTYALNTSGQITRTASGTSRVIAHNVIALLFSRPSASLDIVQVDITLRKTAANRRVIQDAGEIILKMRN
jgi:hypothetical protein